VYLVDDDRTFRRSMERLLTAAGYSVQVFGSPQEFLGAKRSGAPECLLLNLRTPAGGGIELLDRLAAAADTIPVVVLSRQASFQTGVHGMKPGAVEFLVKPVIETELLVAVTNALERDHVARDNRARRDDAVARLGRLTTRERRVCDLVAAGLPNGQIATELGALEKTINSDRGRVMKKVGVNSIEELLRVVDLARTR
jgi:FixJ family two-component response regulator